jgi:hypothetical protein
MTDNDAIFSAVGEGVAPISFNRPDKLNALTPAMLQIFLAKVDAAASDTSVRVNLITGFGRGFSAGLDLSVIGGGVSNDPGQSAVAQGGPAQWPAQWDDSVGPALGTNFGGGWNKLVFPRKPTIAAINESLRIEMLCEQGRRAVTSRHRSATFGLPCTFADQPCPRRCGHAQLTFHDVISASEAVH